MPTSPAYRDLSPESAVAKAASEGVCLAGEHLHSAIGYVTPNDRHFGRDAAIFARRNAVYSAARARHSLRWTGRTREWKHHPVVVLNPERVIETRPMRASALAASC
ncbi:MAG: hypothetical protein Q8Q09_10320 [Deltaproteobacteria bacterium]|nr:hypothetical protein [Deltaproteobacteria bacterium]